METTNAPARVGIDNLELAPCPYHSPKSPRYWCRLCIADKQGEAMKCLSCGMNGDHYCPASVCRPTCDDLDVCLHPEDPDHECPLNRVAVKA